MRTQIYLWEGRFLYVGGNLRTRIHAHHALQIGIPLDYPFRVKVEDGEWTSASGIIVAPDREHECIADGALLAYLSLDPESVDARRLTAELLGDSPIAVLKPSQVAEFSSAMMSIRDLKDGDAVRCIVDRFVGGLCAEGMAQPSRPLETRIARVMGLIREAEDGCPPLNELAAAVGLSGSRLVHLFKEQAGLPIRRYALWVRLNRSFIAITRGQNLTEAAHCAGFADSAHFSRTFSMVFGISPSEILKSSQIVQSFSISL